MVIIFKLVSTRHVELFIIVIIFKLVSTKHVELFGHFSSVFYEIYRHVIFAVIRTESIKTN